MSTVSQDPAAPTVVQTSLSRELLRWIQCLDLAYSVKNVKRDFSNGFLVAEIFSRYYDSAIQMHSFDNGIALRIKKDNWGQLLKFMKKNNLEHLTTQDEVNAIIHCEDGAVVTFINRIYEALTQRKVQAITRRPLPDNTPKYAKHTGAAVLRNTMRSSVLSETNDEVTRQRKLNEKFGDHERSLQEERSIDPDRFSSHSQAAKGMLRSSPQAVGAEVEPVPQVTLKEISVKQVERNIAQLRATKEMGQVPGSGNVVALDMRTPAVPGSLPPIPSKGSPAHPPANVSPYAAGGDSAERTLATIVTRRVGTDSIGSALDPALAFARAVVNEDITETVAVQVLNDIAGEAPGLAMACLGHPKQFWKTAAVLAMFITDMAPDTAVYDAGVATFEALADQILRADASAAMDLFCDFGLPKLLACFKISPAKRPAILRLLYAFSPPDVTSHMQCVKRLQLALDSIPLFLHAVAILVTLETEFDSTSVDTYRYYCIMGMSQSSPTLRAAAVEMLTVLLPEMARSSEASAVPSFLEQLQQLGAQDTWWLVRANIVRVAASVLDPSLDPQIVKAALALASQYFTLTAAVSIQKVGVMALAKCFAWHSELLGMGLQVMLRLAAHDVQALMGLSSGVDMASSTPELRPIVSDADVLLLARALRDFVLESNLENLEVNHLLILEGCVNHQCNTSELTQEWTEVFDGLQDYIFVALCDPDAAAHASFIIQQFAFRSQLKEELLRLKQLIAVFELIFPRDDDGREADVTCQAQCVEMLSNLAAEGQVFRDAVKDAIANLPERPGSALAILATNLSP